jgi:hypothetical protein
MMNVRDIDGKVRALNEPVDSDTPCCICGDALPWEWSPAYGLMISYTRMNYVHAGVFAGFAHKECRETAARILREEMIRKKVQEILAQQTKEPS